MTHFHTLNFFIFCFAVVVSASRYYEVFKFLPRDRATEEANGIQPIITIDDNRVMFENSPNSYYDFKLAFDAKEISRMTVENGPEGFGCFIGSLGRPYRSHFVTKGRDLERAVPSADFVHCYALEFPERDVLVDVLNLEGVRSSIVLNTEQGFGSLPIPRNYRYISSIALVEEPDSNLMCRVDFSSGDPLFMSAQNRELMSISDAESIGCRFL